MRVGAAISQRLSEMNRTLTLLLLGFTSMCTINAGEKAPNLTIAPQPDRFGFTFQEPEYPKGANVTLLQELAWFFGGSGDFKKEKTVANWNDFLARMKVAKLPRLARKTDLSVTKETISNISDQAVLIVLGHQHPVNFDLHIGNYRTHWLPAKGTMKNESGYAVGMDLFWSYPYDVVLGKSFQPPAFLKSANR